MNIQLPDALSLSGNMKEIALSGVTAGEITFRLFTSGSALPLLEQKYAPDSGGIIHIDIHRFIEERQSFVMSSETSPWLQPELACSYYFKIDDLIYPDFTVVKGGVANLSDTAANWLRQNFMTWQPTVKRVTYSTPELLTYYAQEECRVRIKVYYPDGTDELMDPVNLSAGAWTIPVSFATIAAMTDGLPGAYDVWIEDTEGLRLTYVQRYLADSKREDEQWILFENSLGGVDVFRAYGKGSVEAGHEHQIAESDDYLDEYRVDLKRQYRKSTGWMDKEQRRWMLDFFPARRRWIMQDGAMLPIVLIEDTVTYTMDNMPAEFEFTFRYASAKPYLNIPRVEVPAAVMDITAPDMQSFTIPPRLVEFPRLNPSEGGLIPIQHPYSEEWLTLSLEELLSVIYDATEEAAGRFTVDEQYYLWVRQIIDGVPTLHKIKAESADLWSGKAFQDYLDQPVRTTDDVRFGNVEAGGGVSARGITDLNVPAGGGGGGGTVRGAKVGDGDVINPNQDGIIPLPAYPDRLSNLEQDSTHRTVSDTEKSQWNAAASKTVVTYAGLDPTETESAGKVPTAYAVAVLKKQIGVEDNYTAATGTEAMIDGFEDYDSSKVGGYKRGDVFRIGDGGEHIAAYRVIVDMPTFNWGCLQRINYKALATPLQILGTAINELD